MDFVISHCCTTVYCYLVLIGMRLIIVTCMQVISAYQVPYKNEKSLKSERSLTVQVKIVGVEADVQCSRTKTVKNNGMFECVLP